VCREVGCSDDVSRITTELHSATASLSRAIEERDEAKNQMMVLQHAFDQDKADWMNKEKQLNEATVTASSKFISKF
jgi:hypothetical protein